MADRYCIIFEPKLQAANNSFLRSRYVGDDDDGILSCVSVVDAIVQHKVGVGCKFGTIFSRERYPVFYEDGSDQEVFP